MRLPPHGHAVMDSIQGSIGHPEARGPVKDGAHMRASSKLSQVRLGLVQYIAHETLLPDTSSAYGHDVAPMLKELTGIQPVDEGPLHTVPQIACA